MNDQAIFELIKRQVALGVGAQKIQEELLAKGYAPEDINGALARMQLHSSPEVLGAYLEPLTETRPKKNSLPSTLAFSFLLCGILAVGYVMYADMNDSPNLGSLRAMLYSNGTHLMSTFHSLQVKRSPPPPVVETVPSVASSTSDALTEPQASEPALPPSKVIKEEPLPPAVPAPAPAPKVAAPAPGSIPTLTLTASATRVPPGTVVTLTWESKNALSCQGSGFASDGLTNGSVSVIVNGSYQFKMTCTNAEHTASRSVGVTSQR
jgi:hypothetical protein